MTRRARTTNRARSMWVIGAVLFGLFSPTGNVRATGSDGEKEKKELKSRFWDRLVRPSADQEKEVLKKAIAKLRQAENSRGVFRLRLVDQAIDELGKAIAKGLRSAPIFYFYGYALYLNQHYERSLKAFLKSRSLDPKFIYAGDLAFKLGVIYTYQHQYAKAVEEYKKAALRSTKGSEKGIIYSNTAECLMSQGKLTQAIVYYQKSLQSNPYRNAGALWGLAVALDRDEQVRRGLNTAKAAYLADPTLRAIVGTGVFFVPAGEVNYYLAMAHTAAGSMGQAARYWSRFLSTVPKSPFVYRARAHLKQLLGKLGRAKPVVLPLPNATMVQGFSVAPAFGRRLNGTLFGAVKSCYFSRAKKSTPPEGILELSLRLDDRARIAAATASQRSGLVGTDSALMSCISKKAMGKRLPGVKASSQKVMVLLSYRLQLKF